MSKSESKTTAGEPCPECDDYGYLEGCGDCETPCTTEGLVVCKRKCEVCNYAD